MASDVPLLPLQAQEEIAALRREVMMSKTARGPKSSVTAQSILKRVEAERDEATADLHHMTTERDSLRERLKVREAAWSQVHWLNMCVHCVCLYPSYEDVI